MIPVGDILVSNDIAIARFACDLQACKGACCTEPGGTGAPLEEQELALIELAEVDLNNRLLPEAREVIRKRGGWEKIGRNDYATCCVDNRACVFVVYDGPVAICAIQQANKQGRGNWAKPISCFLFPIRVGRFGEETVLNYEPIAACKPAMKKGARDNVFLSDFLQEPLIQMYGKSWYLQFQRACEQKRHALGYDVHLTDDHSRQRT